jgi:hypothetical protein
VARWGPLGWLALGLLLPGGAASAQNAEVVDARLDTLFGAHQPYRDFLERLKAATSSDAREEVSRLVSYPLVTHIAGHKVTIRTPAQFLSHYSLLLPEATLAAVRLQTYADLFANAQGVMIGSGQIWFSGICQDRGCSSRVVRITAINPPRG